MEYRIEAVSGFSLVGLTKKATAKANELASDGWKLVKMQTGWGGFNLSPTIYLAFERNRK